MRLTPRTIATGALLVGAICVACSLRDESSSGAEPSAAARSNDRPLQTRGVFVDYVDGDDGDRPEIPECITNYTGFGCNNPPLGAMPDRCQDGGVLREGVAKTFGGATCVANTCCWTDDTIDVDCEDYCAGAHPTTPHGVCVSQTTTPCARWPGGAVDGYGNPAPPVFGDKCECTTPLVNRDTDGDDPRTPGCVVRFPNHQCGGVPNNRDPDRCGSFDWNTLGDPAYTLQEMTTRNTCVAGCCETSAGSPTTAVRCAAIPPHLRGPPMTCAGRS